MNRKILILNSTLIFITATLLQQTLHEMAHFVTAIVMGSKDVTLYHNCVRHDSSAISMSATIMIAAAGPLFSLLVGFIFQMACVAMQKRNLLFLFFIYMSAFGYINFGGYLMVAPFFKGGDTGFIFLQLGFPLWLIIALSIAGAAFILFAMKMLSKYFVEMASAEIIGDRIQRRSFINAIVKYPLYGGVIVTTLLSLPIPMLLSLLYPLFSPFSLFWVYGYLLGTPYSTANANKEVNQLAVLSPILITACVLTIILNRLLVYGLHW